LTSVRVVPDLVHAGWVHHWQGVSWHKSSREQHVVGVGAPGLIYDVLVHRLKSIAS